MKRGYIILVIGSIILIIGIGLSITSVIDPFLRESTKLSDKVIKPSQSINVSRMVVLSEATPSPSLALSISSKQLDNKEPLLEKKSRILMVQLYLRANSKDNFLLQHNLSPVVTIQSPYLILVIKL